MIIINNRIINENIKMRNSILRNSINCIKHYRAISESDVIKFKYLSKIIIFKSDVYTASAFLYFYYNEYIY